MVFDIFANNRACADNAMTTNTRPSEYDGPASDPTVIPNGHFVAYESLIRNRAVLVSKSMVMIVYPYTLTEYAIVANSNFIKAIDRTVIVEKAMRSQPDRSILGNHYRKTVSYGKAGTVRKPAPIQ